MNTKYQSQSEFDLALAKEMEKVIEMKTGISVRADPTTVVKTNSQVMNGITVHFPQMIPAKQEVAPNLYTKDAYEQYKNGRSIQEIARNVAGAAIAAHERGVEVPELTLEGAKQYVRLVLVNTERNQKLLENTPHFEIGDLSAIPRWFISEEASFIVSNDLAANLMLTSEEVLKIGQQRINEMKFEVVSMQDLLRKMMPTEMADMMFPEEIGGPKMVVMSTPDHMHGASSILSEKALKSAMEMLGLSESESCDSMIVLPSSIHEVICIPDNGDMKPEELRAMVHEVNMTQVSPQEFLSDNIMRYDGMKLTMVTDEPKMEMDTPQMEERTIHYAGIKM